MAGEFHDAHGDGTASFGFLIANALGVVLEDFLGLSFLALADQLFHRLAYIGDGNTPGFGGKQDLHAPFLGNLGPELARENFGMRLEIHAGAEEFVLVLGEDFAQTVDFAAHAIEHLADGVDMRVAALVAFHGESNGNVLGQAEKRGLIGAFGRNLLGDGAESLREAETRASRQSGNARLKCRGGRVCVGFSADRGDLREHLQDAAQLVFLKADQTRFDENCAGAAASAAAAPAWAGT